MSILEDAVLLKMAEAEILREAKRAAIRYTTAGISRWRRCPKANKVFLTNTLLQTVSSNRNLDIKTKKKKDSKCKKCERKFLQKNSQTEVKTNHTYQKPKIIKEKSNVTSKSKRYNINIKSEGNYKSKKEIKEKIKDKKLN